MSKQNEGVVPSNFECKLFLQRMRQGNMARQLAVLQSLQGLGQNYICIARNVSAFDFLRHPIIARRCGMGRIRCGNRASERGIIRRKQRPRARSHIRPMRRTGLMLPSWHSARPAARQCARCGSMRFMPGHLLPCPGWTPVFGTAGACKSGLSNCRRSV